MEASHHIRRIGPLVYIFPAQPSTFGQVARVARVFNQTSGEEFTPVLEHRRTLNQIPELSTDLGHAVEKSVEKYVKVTDAIRTTSILMISWPGKHRNVCSRVSTGSSFKQELDEDIVIDSF